MEKVAITIDLKAGEPEALAIFLKRRNLSDCRAKCQPDAAGDALAYDMQRAGEAVTKALADSGFGPR